MANLNDLFDSLPDYNVFEDSSTPQDKPPKQPPKKAPKVKKRKKVNIDSRGPLDYNDGYGIYVERKTKGHDYLTILYFPILILWLEFALRLGCGEAFSFNSVLYTAAFSLVASCALTFLCTLGKRVFNLVLSNTFTVILTFWFVLQLLWHTKNHRFMRLEDFAGADIGKLMAGVGDNLFFFIIMFVPFLFSMIIGWKIFTFRRIRIPAKISLILFAVLIHISAATMISLSKNNPYTNTSYNLYNHKFAEFKIDECADRFGILCTQRLDIEDMFR